MYLRSTAYYRSIHVWQPRTRRWSRHTDNVEGSSDVKSKKEATRQSDNRNHRVQLGIRCVPRTTPSAVRKNHKQSVSVGEVSADRYLPHIGDLNVIMATWFEQHATFWSTWSHNNNNRSPAAIVPPHNVAPIPAYSSCKTTSTTDVSSVARHHYSHRPHLHHLPVQRRFLNDTGSRLCVFPRNLNSQRRSWLTTTTAWLWHSHPHSQTTAS
jgi:hypothetical protein